MSRAAVGWLTIVSAAFACAPPSPAPEAAAPGLVVMTAAPAGPSSTTASAAAEPAAPEQISVELFVMSRCPYGTRAEVTWAEALRRLENVDLRIGFVGTIGTNGEIKSMRGPSELTGDAAQICAMKYSPKWLQMITCQNRSLADVDFNWRECAADLGMPVDTIEACAFGEEAKTLLAQSFEYGISRGANASPTMFIADRKYTGGRSPKELIAAVCEAAKAKPANMQPPVCNVLATLPEVPVTALVDRRCSSCEAPRADGEPLVALLNPKLTVLDYQTPEGRTLFDSVQPSSAPFYLFANGLDGDLTAHGVLNHRARTTREGRVIEDGAWNPRCADAGGCSNPACKAALPCRSDRPKKVELYLEDSSPLSLRAVLALAEVLDNFEKRKNPLTFAIHQIVLNPQRGSIAASASEIAESRRRLCVQQRKPGKPLLTYLACRAAAQPEDSWESCTGGKTGLDSAAISKCVDGTEGAKLLDASRKRARESDIRSGATFVINERTRLRTIHADALKSAVCHANPKLAGCDAVLSSVLLK